MRWKQFFTPVNSINTEEARKLLAENPATELTILDVRQPREYEAGHLPGAKLIPTPELMGRLDEIERDKPVLVY